MSDMQITNMVIASVFMLGANACANLSAIENKPISVLFTGWGAGMLIAGYIFLLKAAP